MRSLRVEREPPAVHLAQACRVALGVDLAQDGGVERRVRRPAARLLSAAGGQRVTVEMLEADVAAGAPTNPDGTLNLVHYCAWLVKEAAGRGD